MNEQLYHPLVWSMIPRKLKPNMDDAIDAIGDLYNAPTPEPFRFDFENDTILKYAYFYRYFVCISNAVKKCWLKLADLHYPGFLQNKSELNVCCVGGGSGCDLVGLCQFMDYIDMEKRINAVILDYYDWSKETRKLIANIAGAEVYGIVNFNNVRYNFFKVSPIHHAVINEIGNADLVTIVKFLSAVGADKNGVEQLSDLLSNMKRNGRVFYMDNSGGPYRNMMKEVAGAVGLELVSEVVHRKIVVPEEESDQMAHARFRTLPLKSTSVTASLWKKN
uniref:Histidine-specific methyltransferase SAM-dependent domain-containing protein n=1 Tax=Strigamia maritima TaxID=126957 RepID=T1JP43_STRMM